VYLFHWPLYVVAGQLVADNTLAAGIAVAAALALAAAVHSGFDPVITRLRRPSRRQLAWLLAPVVASAALAVPVLARAPEISSLEHELLVANVQQDRDRVSALLAVAATPVPTPVPTPGGTPKNGPLTALPGPATGPTATGSAGTEPVPTESPTPATPEPPTQPVGVSIIGDSVCLGARTELLAAIPDSTVDAAGSRNLAQGLELAEQMQAEGPLRETVVFSLGTNVTRDALANVDRIVDEIAPGHRLVFVTPFSTKAKPATITYKTMAYMRTLPERYGFVTVADWAAAIGPQAALLGADGIHIGGNPAAKDIYLRTITDALDTAATRPPKQ
jgi:hypothetical protein